MSSTSSSPKEETYEEEDREFESQAKRLKTEEGEIVYSAEEGDNRQEATPQAGSDSDGGGGEGGSGGGRGDGGGDDEEGDGGEEGDGDEEGDEGDGEEAASGDDEGGSGGGGGPRSMPQSSVTKRGATSPVAGPGLASRPLARPPACLCRCADSGFFIYSWPTFPGTMPARGVGPPGVDRGAPWARGGSRGGGGRRFRSGRARPRALGGIGPFVRWDGSGWDPAVYGILRCGPPPREGFRGPVSWKAATG